jgi:hypothetical protein
MFVFRSIDHHPSHISIIAFCHFFKLSGMEKGAHVFCVNDFLIVANDDNGSNPIEKNKYPIFC